MLYRHINKITTEINISLTHPRKINKNIESYYSENWLITSGLEKNCDKIYELPI